MGRNSTESYLEAARTVLSSAKKGTLSSQALVKTVQEQGLLDNNKWLYHNLLRRVRESNEFDTSVRGQVSLSNWNTQESPAPVAEVPMPMSNFSETSTEETTIPEF